jgi:hypothetical protein
MALMLNDLLLLCVEHPCYCLLLRLQTYKAEVLVFLRALPTAALAQLVRLPEPASLPCRQLPSKQQGSQQQQQQLVAKPGKAGSAALEAASAAAAVFQCLQSSMLSESWLRASSRTAAAAAAAAAAADEDDADCQAAGLPPVLSRLARLCCGLAPSVGNDDSTDEQLPLLRPNAGPAARKYAAAAPADQQDSSAGNPAAAALAAAHVANLRGPCCSGCSSAQAVHDAAALMSCSCRCHPASSADDRQAAAPLLPDFDTVIGLLEAASEGTWLCNPRLLQQQHTSGCSCSVCLGLVSPAATTAAGKGGSSRREGAGAAALHSAGPAAGWLPEAVMASISQGLDVLDVLGEWGVDDAALSYAVERRLVTAFHRVSRVWAGCSVGLQCMHVHRHLSLCRFSMLITMHIMC